MKAYDELYNDYESYLEHMVSHGGADSAYDFENWIKWQLRISNITNEEFDLCYDEEGHFIEPKLKSDYESVWINQ